MSWPIAVALASALLNGIVGSLSYIRSQGRPVYRSFAVLGFSCSFWSLAYMRAWPEFSDPLWMKLLYTPLAWLAGATLSFVWSYTGLPEPQRRLRTWPFYGAAMILIGMLWTGRMSVERYRFAFIVSGVPIFGGALYLLASHWWSCPYGDERNRRGYMLLASAIGILGGFTDFIPIGGRLLSLANVSFMAYSVIVLLAIGRLHLLDLRAALRQTLAVTAVAVVLGGFLTGLAWLTRILDGPLFLNFFLVSLLLVALLPPAWRHINAPFNRFFFEAQARNELTLEELDRSLQPGLDVAGICAKTRSAFRKTWGAEAEFLWARGALRGLGAGPDLPEALRAALTDEEEVITAAQLRRARGGEKALAELSARRAEAAAPILRDGELIGALLAGAPVKGFYDLAAVRWLRRASLSVGRAVESAELTQGLLHADRLAQLGTLAAGIAHEVRNPLSAILGAVQFMREDLKEEEKREMIRIMTSEVERLDGTLKELLDYSSAQPKKGRCAWRAVWAHTEKLMRPTLPRGLNLETSGDPLEFAVSPAHLEQILLNLVRNAARAAVLPGAGAPPRVLVSVAKRGPNALLSIEDNGPGIPEDLLPRLFTPFTSQSEGGTGLGLATVRRLAELYGGRAWAENLGPGARFVVELPVS